jgi:hypothetical protein
MPIVGTQHFHPRLEELLIMSLRGKPCPSVRLSIAFPERSETHLSVTCCFCSCPRDRSTRRELQPFQLPSDYEEINIQQSDSSLCNAAMETA